MNCQSFRAIVYEIDQPGGVEASALDTALGHAQACTRCARQLHRTREVAAMLRALAFADEDQQASGRTEERLLDAFRTQTGRRLHWKTVAGWMAAAAALVLALGGGLLWRHASRTGWMVPGEPPDPAAAQVTAIAPAAGGSQAPSLLLGAGRPARPALDAAHGAPTSAAHRLLPVRENSADLNDFIPLPFADDDEPLGSAEVVRIRLSEADLGLLGLSVSEEAYTQPLTADVVIGEDGVARAIRFVQEPL
ncbi:MAG TPA: hypothetical protein VI455_01940 [Terriglobia bacterium]